MSEYDIDSMEISRISFNPKLDQKQKPFNFKNRIQNVKNGRIRIKR